MVIIRDYNEKTDAPAVGILIADTYRKYNLDFGSPREQEKLLGPFQNARSVEPSHQEAIRRVLQAEIIFVAEDGDQIVGVLRCKPGRLHSLFVREDYHRKGIRRNLMGRCGQAEATLQQLYGVVIIGEGLLLTLPDGLAITKTALSHAIHSAARRQHARSLGDADFFHQSGKESGFKLRGCFIGSLDFQLDSLKEEHL